MSRFDAGRFQAQRRGAFGADLRLHDALGSTQDQARQALSQGALEGCVVLAEAQKAGRGRWGRQWVAAPGQGLLCTLVLRVETGAGTPGGLPLLLGVEAALALRELGLAEAALKWPNDLWWRGRKLGGLLVEAVDGHWLAGLGLNLEPAVDVEGAASLAEAGLDLGREAVLAAVLGRWEEGLGRWRAEGDRAWRAGFAALDALRGRPVRARAGGLEWSGLAEGVAPDGALLLRTAEGLRSLASADVEFLRPQDATGGPHAGDGGTGGEHG